MFNNQFFEKVLNIKATHDIPFTIKSFTIDSRVEDKEHSYCFVGIAGENFDGNDFFQSAYDNGVRVFLLQKNPQNIPADAVVYLVEDTIIAIADLARAYEDQLDLTSILITGSVGKTTTRLMIHHVLKQYFATHTAKKNWNNHIGLPMTILETPSSTDVSVLEAGMSARGEIKHLSEIVRPDIAVITNIGYSHAEHIGGMDQVAECKIEIVEGMGAESVLLINQQDPYKELFISKAKGQVRFFNPDDLQIIEDLRLQGFKFTHKKYPNEIFLCPVAGKHLLLNLAIMFECVDLLNVPIKCVNQGLKELPESLFGRMRIFTNHNDVTVIDDCYNASLESFKAALDVLSNTNEGRRIVVMGDVLELGAQSEKVHREIGRKISELKNIDLVLAVGEQMSYACSELRVPYCHFMDKVDIWEVLKKELQAKDTVLVKASNGMKLSVLVSCLEGKTIS
ncbi:MAG: UDP-N-acetylmuramoyl-tripeptide--D-alanyl-D-alanine ligase [Brevinema sp.]